MLGSYSSIRFLGTNLLKLECTSNDMNKFFMLMRPFTSRILWCLYWYRLTLLHLILLFDNEEEGCRRNNKIPEVDQPQYSRVSLGSVF